jgi:hypothetical protein
MPEQDKPKPKITPIDWFILDTMQPAIEITEELEGTLVHYATQYLKMGKRLSWEEFSNLGEVSRKAFEEAADMLRIESAFAGKAQ